MKDIEEMNPIELIIYILTYAVKPKFGFMHAINQIKKGGNITINFFDGNANTRHELARWGGDFTVTIENNKIVSNSLVERAWNYDEEKAAKEANHAILFFARQLENDKQSMTYTIKREANKH